MNKGQFLDTESWVFLPTLLAPRMFSVGIPHFLTKQSFVAYVTTVAFKVVFNHESSKSAFSVFSLGL